ncbi:hemolysin family protein [Mobilicoccus caccae]|uniref:Membrane protein n=1 Tax=Mobilicoccus caccae TaxID=1859295 RepID=A0ABQ6IXM6_9MICO|nr:hemolysin family protein [Mobilicoccus caccae]GMA42259.1 membrane protein [Mobilicoccus caccae]
MDGLLINVALVLAFILLGGVFAASEIALVSLRDSQIGGMAERGGSGLVVQRLTQDSNRFLSAVQVGVTLAGFFSASFGAATIAPYLAPWLEQLGVVDTVSDTLAFVLTTLAISYLSLVLGELVPKRLAMQSAEGFALVVARPLDTIATVLRPVIWFLGLSTNVVMRLLGRNPEEQKESMDAAELRAIVAEQEDLGEDERGMVVDILAAGERTVSEIMTPRTEVDFLEATLPVGEARRVVQSLERSRYPVSDNGVDDVIGFLHIRDLLIDESSTVAGHGLQVGDLVREILVMPGSTPLFACLTHMREARSHLALVVDEYGGTDGIVTLEDVMEEFVGEIEDEYDQAEPIRIVRPGRREVSGLLGRAEAGKVLGVELPEGPYDTIGGLVMHLLGRLPEVGDEVTWDVFTLTVLEMDGRRVDRVEARRHADETRLADERERSAAIVR